MGCNGAFTLLSACTRHFPVGFHACVKALPPMHFCFTLCTVSACLKHLPLVLTKTVTAPGCVGKETESTSISELDFYMEY